MIKFKLLVFAFQPILKPTSHSRNDGGILDAEVGLQKIANSLVGRGIEERGRELGKGHPETLEIVELFS